MRSLGQRQQNRPRLCMPVHAHQNRREIVRQPRIAGVQLGGPAQRRLRLRQPVGPRQHATQ